MGVAEVQKRVSTGEQRVSTGVAKVQNRVRTGVAESYYRCSRVITGVAEVQLWNSPGVAEVSQTHLEDLEHVQAVVDRCEQQAGQNVLDSLFEAFTDGLKIETQTMRYLLLPLVTLLYFYYYDKEDDEGERQSESVSIVTCRPRQLHFFTHSWRKKQKKKKTTLEQGWAGLTCRWKAAPGLDT